ncbi:nuclear transport factor 2 family protein [Streptomyces sp. YS415]|uniref:nuclear transport factor 2 family protein n=1 Tax=Streptomyces sp. YS415 TaxID=2944806 RepID=UPI0020201A11|nr:nuclear transport factor 2 family protein [Streptomyces sp. YS415]MCL7424496.1 nuclear transport factor 2 family protein [Streptomyces sp. YS415]
MTEVAAVPDQAPDGSLFQQIQQFYARQMRLLDHGAVEEWADTFTEDGVFDQNVAGPLTGRATIAVAAQKRVDQIVAEGITRRHWLGMLEVDPRDEQGVVRTRYYAFSMATERGGRPQITASTYAEDSLVRHEGGWLVRYRRVTHDGTT